MENDENSPSAAVALALTKKRKGDNRGRHKDPIWDSTTVLPDKTVVCNHCHNIIHRHGVTKVERVRAHFERRCPQNKKTKRDHDDTTDTALTAIKPSPGSKTGMFKRKFAHWLYATGHSFDDAGDELLLDALKMLRNDIMLPTKHELENELLDLEFSASQNKVTKALNDKPCCLTVESWVDAGGNVVTSYGAVCEKISYFLESTTFQERGSAELAVDDVERVMSNLLVDDMSSILPWLEKFQASMAEMASVFHGNHKLQSLVSTDQSNPFVEFPDSGSVCGMLESILDHEKKLYTIVARRDFVQANTPVEQEKLNRVRDFVLSEMFIQELVKSLEILRPLQQQLKHFQDDRAPVSQVYPCFMDLLNGYASMEWLSKKEKALIASCVTERFDAIYGESHGVANLLDPLYLGQTLDASKKQEAEAFIVRFCTRDDQTVDVLEQLEEYNEMVAGLKVNDEAYWHLLQSGTVQPFDFWMERQQFPLLQQLAWTVFALPVSSMSPTQSFSSQAFYIDSRFNHTLSPEKLQKLTHVYCNSKNRDEGMSFLTP
ncbi:hypothetical protein BBJ29_009459 [Phytophthora kernoviae]|uniref:BED-type domain-containing protein n=1 Tax=Phytophthora kernoviae TaxID=325452 RepID=A0A3F2RCA0_9STRA|nr:hypothetical protein BBJ29_009459 [Phytophthora kernoviae]RLN52629.1 hypothetical protein BBP00_00009550 [Phytophthora kernoviae]